MAAGVILSHLTDVPVMPPPWMKAIAFAMIGWAIGLRFTPELLRHAARVFPVVLAATLAMIFTNGLVAVALIGPTQLDFLLLSARVPEGRTRLRSSRRRCRSTSLL